MSDYIYQHTKYYNNLQIIHGATTRFLLHIQYIDMVC